MKKSLIIALIMAMLLSLTMCSLISDISSNASNGSKITSLSMYKNDDQTLTVGGYGYRSWVNVRPRSFDDGDIIFVSTDENVAIIEPSTKTSGALWFEVTAVSGGKAEVYAQSRDGKIISDKILITVRGEDWIENLEFNKSGHQTTSNGKHRDWLKVKPYKYDENVIEFICSDETIATVTKSTAAAAGLWFDVVFIIKGTVTITAVADNGVVSDKLTITYN